MSTLRTIAGAGLGVAAGLFAIRVKQIAEHEGRSPLEVAADTPTWLQRDVQCLADSLVEAAQDGQEARRRAAIAFDGKVAGAARRTKESDE